MQSMSRLEKSLRKHNTERAGQFPESMRTRRRFEA